MALTGVNAKNIIKLCLFASFSNLDIHVDVKRGRLNVRGKSSLLFTSFHAGLMW